ncbi:hypothetical protein Barba22A_gp024 [Rheinheimera phage vB_RspM_Barba22A]|jgi:hypothetical protein|uniref:Uncharacterized protein n=83 Tax=Barbavirus TaxID=2733095 RepID=A0A7G9VS51_9CAUD|nr:hypothetical protein HOV44_gp026 [Rheinheimera phage Barba5S]YP_009822762.1 hypothetical protein HOV45_gp026 [Rheinheimera phage Barba8S]YP_009822901.1 hypothetical protein HOV46_gp024 [Rheinheimera phage vB_RspM_Barba18A]YP_009823180.1 hypothetical protein HOV48_gp024 [Rheinheimera phage Barba21A]QCQ57875.1 hypothetical protein Barba1A_gp024 [Rheinheimera phage vB_RspM_Barba1A]QCQ58011.1 hypothetical protein Barba1S_gp024 [Rheinheimera phage vB_RspM_Barba1S]QCQ58147.1 hypothetical protein
MNELQTSVLSTLKELADSYNLTFSYSDDYQLVFFSKPEVGFLDPSFALAIEWKVKKANIFRLNKTIELHQIDDCCRLLCEVIA